MKDTDAMFVTCPVLRGTGSIMLKISKAYTAIVADLGFTTVTDPAAANAKQVCVSDAVRSGDITKIRISVKGSTAKPPKSVHIYCSTKEVAGAMGKIAQKQYGSSTITGVGSIQRARYK